MDKPVPAMIQRVMKILRNGLETVVQPKWLPLAFIFLILYIPFVTKFGLLGLSAEHTDLPSFYSASVSAFSNGESPYNPDRLQPIMGDDVNVYPYLYPPPSLLLFYPLSLLTYEGAARITLLANHLLIVVLLWILPLELLRPRPKDRFGVLALSLVYVLSFRPLTVTLEHGQVNILLLTFVSLFWICSRNGKMALAGLFLALSVLLKTYPVLLLPLLVLIGRWRESAYTLAWLGIAVILSIGVLPGEAWGDWFHNVLPTGGYMNRPDGLFSPAAIWNQSLNGFIARGFTDNPWSDPIVVNPHLGRIITYGLAGIIAFVTTASTWHSRKHVDRLDHMMLASLPATYLIAPFSWEHHIVYLLPVILVLLNSRCHPSFGPRIPFYVLCVTTAVVISASGMLPYKFFGVGSLWLLAIAATWNKQIVLPSGRMETVKKQESDS